MEAIPPLQNHNVLYRKCRSGLARYRASLDF